MVLFDNNKSESTIYFFLPQILEPGSLFFYHLDLYKIVYFLITEEIKIQLIK